jgi:hypothetical protein
VAVLRRSRIANGATTALAHDIARRARWITSRRTRLVISPSHPRAMTLTFSPSSRPGWASHSSSALHPAVRAQFDDPAYGERTLALPATE